MLSGVEFFLFSSSEDEIDEVEIASQDVQMEEIEKNSLIRIRKKEPRFTNNVLAMPDQEFLVNFGMDKNCFMELLSEVAPWMRKGLRTTLMPPMVKLGTFLRCLVTGSHQDSVGNEYLPKLSQGCVSRTISECLDIFEQHLCPKWIRFEMSEEEENKIKKMFLTNYGISGTIGCVGGTHIKLRPPGDVRHLFYNTNKYYSINAMMICDYNAVIRYVDARAPGSNCNADVWRTSLADEYLMSAYKAGKVNTWVLGDSRYPLLPYLMVPYQEPKHHYEIAYNAKLLKTLETITSCLGILKSRFRIITGDKGLNYSPAAATKIINTCCALHNYCISNKNQWQISEEVEPPNAKYFNVEEIPSIEAVHIRNELSQAICK